jgi:hypothetical protein
MKSNLQFCGFAVLALAIPLRAASEKKPEPRTIRSCVVREQWRAEYTRNSMGLLVDAELKPSECAPSPLGVLVAGKPVALRESTNAFGDSLRVDGETLSLGIITPSGEGHSAPPGNGRTAKAPELTPLRTVALPGKNNLVCLYPKQRKLWTDFGAMVLALDGATLENKVALFNASVQVVGVRTLANQNCTLKPGECRLVDCRKNDEGYPAQVLINSAEGPRVIANTRIPSSKAALATLIFTNVDTQISPAGVAFVHGEVSLSAPNAEVVGKSPMKTASGK